MSQKSEEIYFKSIEESVGLKIPKELILTLLRQINRYLEILRCEEEIIDNFEVRDNINNAEMIITKLFLLIAEPYEREKVVLFVTIAEFLVLRDLVYCNYSLPHLKVKMAPHILKTYKKFYDDIESIFGMLEQAEVKAYWDYIINYNTKGNTLH